jgi:hypothetical protein
MNLSTEERHAEHNLLMAWDTIQSKILENCGPVSVRIATGETHSVTDVSGPYGQDVDLNRGDIELLQEFASVVQAEVPHLDADTITISSECIIQSATPNATEFDLAIQRRLDACGEIKETEDDFSLTDPGGDWPVERPSVDLHLFERTPVEVGLYDQKSSKRIPLQYVGSCVLEDFKTIKKLGLQDVLEAAPDENSIQLICDIHETPDGARSQTITRDAKTEDGPMRRIIYSNIQC